MYCCCSCTTAAAARALFWNMSLEKLVYWIICNVMHLSLPNLVHIGSLTFWIDSKEYWFSCSCNTAAAAAAAGLFPDKKLIKVVNWIVFIMIYLVPLNLVQNGYLIFWIDAAAVAAAAVQLLQLQYYWWNCGTVAAAAVLFSDIKLNWIIMSHIYQFSVFTSLAWLPLQLQLQWKHLFESMLIIKITLYNKFCKIE